MNGPRVFFELISHSAKAAPSRAETKLLAGIQRATLHAHPDAKVVPVIVL